VIKEDGAKRGRTRLCPTALSFQDWLHVESTVVSLLFVTNVMLDRTRLALLYPTIYLVFLALCLSL
jgi:hypothetical protein